MSDSLAASPALLKLLARPSLADPELLRGFENGEVATRKANAFRTRHRRRIWNPFEPAAHPRRNPDRVKAIRRRRTLAATYPTPPAMAAELTTSQIAFARIVADEVREKGRCDRTLDELADRAGMCRKTAKRAQDRLRLLGWITVEERPVEGAKHKANVLRIVSTEWVAWIKRGPRSRSIGGHSCPTSETGSFLTAKTERGERRKRAFEGEFVAGDPPKRSKGGRHAPT